MEMDDRYQYFYLIKKKRKVERQKGLIFYFKLDMQKNLYVFLKGMFPRAQDDASWLARVPSTGRFSCSRALLICDSSNFKYLLPNSSLLFPKFRIFFLLSILGTFAPSL